MGHALTLTSTGSLWADGVPADPPRPGLDGSVDADVAIVGGGYTGLWTALHLLRADPSTRVIVLEKDVCGFGASGRNGGWASALFAGSRAATAERHGRDAAIALQRAMHRAVDQLGAAAADEGIECDFRKGGTLTLATTAAQEERVRAEVDDEHRWGFGDDDLRWLDSEEASARIGAAGLRGAAFTPHCARIHPARLARGLAAAVERRGATVVEGTAVERIEPGRAVTSGGVVRAPIMVRATEGYTAALPGLHRRLVPIHSLMIATEPLGGTAWDEVGWDGAETVTDGRHLLVYAQRTADGRIAFGGRGAPYRYGSRIGERAERRPSVFADLERSLRALLPGVGDTAVSHRWGGPLGVPRDWYSSVGLDRATGLAWGGGYVGDGVTTSFLAGRTLADLIAGRDTELTALPWVNHRSRTWEPEPLRWLGINAGVRLSAAADRAEARTGRRARRHERALRALVGR